MLHSQYSDANQSNEFLLTYTHQDLFIILYIDLLYKHH